MSYGWDLSLLKEYRAAFGQGLLVTLYLTGSSILIGIRPAFRGNWEVA